MAEKKKNSKRSKNEKMPGFFESSGPLVLGKRPEGYYEVQKELKKGKK